MESAFELCIQFFRFTVVVWITMFETIIILEFISNLEVFSAKDEETPIRKDF